MPIDGRGQVVYKSLVLVALGVHVNHAVKRVQL